MCSVKECNAKLTKDIPLHYSVGCVGLEEMSF